MKQVKTEGITLSRKDMWEKDRVLEVFSPELGKISVIARGGSTLKSRFSGSLDVMGHNQFCLYRGRSFFYITHCDPITSFGVIRSDFNRISMAAYFFDILKKTTAYGQSNEGLYVLLKKTLELLEAGKEIRKIKHWFHYHFLRLEGLLTADAGSVSEAEFQRHFEDYSGRSLSQPLELTGRAPHC